MIERKICGMEFPVGEILRNQVLIIQICNTINV